MLNNLELLKEYLNSKSADGKVNEETVGIYEKEIGEFIEYLYPENLLTISEYKIIQYIELLEKSYSKRSIKRRLISIRGLYKYFLKKQKLLKDPFENIKLDIADIKVEKDVEGSEIKNISNYCPEDPKGVRDRLLIALLFSSGLKINDLLSIRVQDIINFREINILKKDGRVVLNLDDEDSKILKMYMENYRNSIEEENLELLFKNLSRQNFRARFIKYKKMAGFDKNILPSDIKKISVKNYSEERERKDEILDIIKKEYMRIGIGDD